MPSIGSYDVEPVDLRRPVAWGLGAVTTVTGVLAVIGWPLPVVSRHGRPSDAWDRTVTLVQEWAAHDGWRMSGASWLWGGLAVAATIGAVVVRASRPGHALSRRASVAVLLPGGVTAVTGPVVQAALGVPWSNYSAPEVDRPAVVVAVLVIAGVLALPLLQHWVSRGRPPTGSSAGERHNRATRP